MEKLLTRSFPNAHLTPAEAWGGIYHQTSSDLPVIERIGSRGDIVANAGYGGTGVAMTLICARIAAALARGEKFADTADKRLHETMRSTRIPIGALARFGIGVAADILRMRFPQTPL